MVLILPEARSHSHCPVGHTTGGMRSSIEHMLASDCNADLSRVSVRVLGSYVIIEGLIEDEESIPEIISLAETIAGAGNVRLNLFRH